MAAKTPPPQVPPTERVQASYKQLSSAATSLNTASDELARAMALWDDALMKLNLGVSSWVQLSGSDDDGYWWSRELGYSKVKEKWGLSLRTSSGHHANPDDDSETAWLLNEAPRWLRIDAVAKLPDLLDALLKEAENTTSRIKTKTALAYELAAACFEAGKMVGDVKANERDAAIKTPLTNSITRFSAMLKAQETAGVNLAALAADLPSMTVPSEIATMMKASETANPKRTDFGKTELGKTLADMEKNQTASHLADQYLRGNRK